jgi:pimeloyl-ACP methyl ester carboxylesterase
MELTVDGKRAFAGTGGRDRQPGAPYVVLLHGAGMDHTIYALQTRALAHHGRNVLAFDFPGHGRSAGPALDSIGGLADWVLRAAAAAGAERFRIAGHSMGALVALEVAARGGGRIEAVALLGLAPEMRVHPDLLAAARAGSHTALELMIDWSLGTQGKRGPNQAPGLWLSGGALRLLERADSRSLAADLGACDAYRGAAESARKIASPVLLLLGGEDRMTPASRGQAFAEHLASSSVLVIPAAGHLLPIEDPPATLAALRRVL